MTTIQQPFRVTIDTEADGRSVSRVFATQTEAIAFGQSIRLQPGEVMTVAPELAVAAPRLNDSPRWPHSYHVDHGFFERGCYDCNSAEAIMRRAERKAR